MISKHTTSSEYSQYLFQAITDLVKQFNQQLDYTPQYLYAHRKKSQSSGLSNQSKNLSTKITQTNFNNINDQKQKQDLQYLHRSVSSNNTQNQLQLRYPGKKSQQVESESNYKLNSNQKNQASKINRQYNMTQYTKTKQSQKQRNINKTLNKQKSNAQIGQFKKEHKNQLILKNKLINSEQFIPLENRQHKKQKYVNQYSQKILKKSPLKDTKFIQRIQIYTNKKNQNLKHIQNNINSTTSFIPKIDPKSNMIASLSHKKLKQQGVFSRISKSKSKHKLPTFDQQNEEKYEHKSMNRNKSRVKILEQKVEVEIIKLDLTNNIYYIKNETQEDIKKQGEEKRQQIIKDLKDLLLKQKINKEYHKYL